MLGAAEETLSESMRERWRLVEKAIAHHENGAFEASVPILLAQIDGLTSDLGVEKIFDKSKNARLFQDDSTLLGMAESLENLRRVFAASAPRTSTHGKLSRHGVLHGRELRYDSLINSTKCIVLLASVVEWSQPRIRKLLDERHKAEETKWAGSSEVNEFGRRRDRRNFADAKAVLGAVDLRQTIVRSRIGRYSDQIDEIFPLTTWRWDQLDRQRLTIAVHSDGDLYLAWYETVSGFVLGTAALHGKSGVWHFAGETSPVDVPGADVRWRHTMTDPAHPDW
jgi:hypothetical protein